MNTYIIADTHFNHGNIIELAHRPFKNAREMDNSMIKRWNSTVTNDDLVIHLGDFALFSLESDYFKRLIGSLNGKSKILVLGNHDKKGKTNTWFLNNGFSFVCDRFELQIKNKKLLFIHNPVQVTNTEEHKYFKIFYGHTHTHTYQSMNPNQNKKFINCCVEQPYINYIPRKLDYLLKLQYPNLSQNSPYFKSL